MMVTRTARLVASLAALSMGLLLIRPTAARADQTLGTFGTWKVTSGTTQNQPSCNITWSTADDALTLILSANLSSPTTFSLYLWRSNWLFPPGSTQSVTLNFDGKPQVLSGNGINHTITVNLDATTFRPFLHGFTGGRSLSIAAPGDATPGLIGLEGTTAAVTELGQCTVADGFTQLPAPFAPATPATEAAAKASIQAASPSTATQSASPPDPFGDVRAKPLAQADYAGKALSISYGGLQATLEPDTSIDPQVCNDSKVSILLYEVSADNSSKACQIIKEIVDVNSKQVINAPVAIFDSSTTYDALDLSLAIRHLDSSSSLPQVIVSGNTGGAHCCVISAAATETSDTKWQIIQLGAVDGNGFDFLNLTHGGDDLLVISNDDFLYKFSSYAGSNAPTRILQLGGVHLQDVTANPAYRNFLLRELKSMETFEAQSSDSEPNGYLAGWVAQKALVGQFDDAWRVMLNSYDHQATDGLSDCAIDKRDWVKRGGLPRSISVIFGGRGLHYAAAECEGGL
jgi:hypothetical protein